MEYTDRYKLFRARKLAYAKRHLSTRNVPDKKNGGYLRYEETGEYVQVPNFGEGLQKTIADAVFAKMEEIGYKRHECIEIWNKETGIGEMDAKKYFYGIQKGMQVWEMSHFLKTFNFSIDLRYNDHQRFVHEIERDRLIIRCKRHPVFHINMNTKNFLDFELEFKNQNEALKFSQHRLNGLFKLMLESYFLKKARNKKMPFKYQNARIKFESKIIDMREKLDQL